MSVTIPLPPTAASPSRPTLRRARFEDHAQVAALEAKFDLIPKKYEEWAHLWIHNPAYRENRDFPIGWVLESGDGSVVGYLGNIPLHYEFQGRKLLAAVTRAWVVDIAYRSCALALLSAYFRQKNVDLFPNTSVNQVAGKAYERLFRGGPVPVGAWDQARFWITHSRGFTESFLRGKNVPCAGPLSYPISGLVYALDRLKRGRLRQNPVMRVNAVSDFDDRFDGFWTALRKRKSHMLLAMRSREILAWHFKFALIQKTAWIYTIDGADGLIAYAVFNLRERHAVRLSSMRLTDFQCLDEERAPAMLAAILQVAAARCREESVPMLELTGLHPRFEEAVQRLAPHRQQLSNWRYFWKANRPQLAEQLKNPVAWDPWLFDGDSAL